MNSSNKLRIQLIVQLALVAYSGGTISWMHKIHLFVQPLIFFCTLESSWSVRAAWILLFASGLDTLVFASSLILASRCFSNVNPNCIQQIFDLTLIVSGIHIILDVFQLLNLSLVKSNTVETSTRLRIITWFLFVQDSCWILTLPEGVEWLILVHPVFNVFVFWISSSLDPIKFYIVVALSALIMIFDTYILFQQGDSYTDLLAYGFISMYIFTDLLFIFFAWNYVDTLKRG